MAERASSRRRARGVAWAWAGSWEAPVAGSAVVRIGGAVEATLGWAYVKEVLRKAVSLTIDVAFVVNFYVLSLQHRPSPNHAV